MTARGFNSRAREGRDKNANMEDWEDFVSIHAPARGATGAEDANLVIESFNSRAREGRDQYNAKGLVQLERFQFTRPRGARPFLFFVNTASLLFQFTRPRGARRHVVHSLFYLERRFNSRAREGRDVAGLAAAVYLTAFQFTRPRGARRVAQVAVVPVHVSIHAPARGATERSPPVGVAHAGFNSRAREGRDARETMTFPRSMGFNSRAREGRDTEV